MNVKTKFLTYCHRKQTPINEGYCDISTDEEGATGFFATKTGKIKRPFCAPAPPKQAHREPWTRHSTPQAAVGTSTHPELTENWNLRIYNELLGSIILGFQSEGFHLKETQLKYFVFFQAKLQTLRS